MNDEVVRKHFAAIEAQFELLKVQFAALRHELGIELPRARVAEMPRPERCKDVAPAMCGLRNADAKIPRGNFTAPRAWCCVGCREVVNPDVPPVAVAVTG